MLRKVSLMPTATLRVGGLKVTVPLAADALPRDLVPADGPAGDPVLDLVLEGGALTVRAKLNGKNYRKLLKQVADHGAGDVGGGAQGGVGAAGGGGGAVGAGGGRLPAGGEGP